MKKGFFVLLSVLVLYGHVRVVRADTLLENRSFFVSSQYDNRQRTQVHATLRIVSQKAYIYVEDEYWNSTDTAFQNQIINQAQVLANEFDNRIYPTETQFFGAEPNPGIDNDPRITIVLTPLVEYAGGYYDTANEVARTKEPSSNEREIIFLNIGVLNDTRRIESFLTHEFQHMISFNQKDLIQKVDDDVWLNEFRSEYAVDLLGYNEPLVGSNLERREQAFLNNPSDSITEWRNQTDDYGQIALFGVYLGHHFLPKVIADTTKNNLAGINSLNAALAANGYKQTFQDIFVDWMVANILNSTTINPLYGYAQDYLKSLHVSPTRTFSNFGDDVIFLASDSIKDWQQHWYDINPILPGKNSAIKISLSSPSLTSFSLPYLVFSNDGTVQLYTFAPNADSSVLYIKDAGTTINRVVLMPFKKDRLAGFSGNEEPVRLTMRMERVDVTTVPALSPTIINPASSSYQSPAPTPSPITPAAVHPGQFGLKEGDFIRAEGDNNIYIVNEYGYKRLVLSPKICLQYGHLGKRGCFAAVKKVTPTVRDAFTTSWYYTNGETHDGVIYKMETTGEDTAVLRRVAQPADLHSIFFFNTREQRSY